LRFRELFGRYRMERNVEDAQDTTSLDVGCGFIEGNNAPIYATVSLDLNMNKVDPRFLKKLRDHGSHPLGADALNLPIRDGCLGRVYWRAVLEHLPDPMRAVIDGRRALREGGEAVVDLPMITDHMRYNLVSLFTGFPLSIVPIVAMLIDAGRYWNIPGVAHIRDVKPSHLQRYFKDVVVETQPKHHPWFRGPQARFLTKLTRGFMMPDIQGQYHVRCR